MNRKNKVRVGLRRQRGGIGKTRHEQDRQAGSANSDASGNFDPVHPGHDEIHDHQINPIAFLAKTLEALKTDQAEQLATASPAVAAAVETAAEAQKPADARLLQSGEALLNLTAICHDAHSRAPA